MNYLHDALGILFAFCLMVTLLITSVEAVAYWTPGYYEQEYTKYHVADEVHMELDDLLSVTREMMAYLRGGREDLHIPTIVDGQPREFFNEREIAHMEDVRALFLGGLAIRALCMAGAGVCVLLLLLLKARILQVLPRAICIGSGVFLALLCGLAALISTDFTKYFVLFHHIFFDNDLWLLDPGTDLLINIVPEPFFVDTAVRIALVFAGSVLAIFFLCLFLIRRTRTRKGLLSALLCASLTWGLFPLKAQAAPAWPDNISIQAEGGIVIDADTGAVLFGKNIHSTYYPASITKILTALIVIERCELDELVVFSRNAVYNVEAGSSSAGLDVGDVLTVRDCLYALLLKSANEAANALAEHVAGTTESFAELMNVRAAALGCQDSHFVNPSGLNDPNHYTSAYDMALIGRAALQNDTFMEIDSTLFYDLPVTRNNKQGLRIYPGHKMIKKNMPEYYIGALGGKTGYTSLAGNTLVTFARRDGLSLVAVVLNGHSTHYSDTRAMLNFGFRNFLSIPAVDFDTDFTSIENDMTIAGLSPTGLFGLELEPTRKITIPKGAVFSSVSSQLAYDLTEEDPAGSIARVRYFWEERPIGFTYLVIKSIAPDQVMMPAPVLSLSESSGQEAPSPADPALEESSAADVPPPVSQEGQEAPAPPAPPFLSGIPVPVRIAAGGLGLAALVAAFVFFFRRHTIRKEEQARLMRRQKRLERLEQSGISSEQFDSLVKQWRSAVAHRRGFRLRNKNNDNLS